MDEHNRILGCSPLVTFSLCKSAAKFRLLPTENRRAFLSMRRLPGPRAVFPLFGGSALLTAGTDCRIRHWDRIHVDGNFIVAGPTLRSNGQQLPQPRVETRVISGVRVTQELPQPEEGKSAAAGSPEAAPGTKSGGQNPNVLTAAAVADSAGCHRDAILALAGAQTSQKILISASRDGVIKVWK